MLICSQGSLKKERTWPEITEQSIVKRLLPMKPGLDIEKRENGKGKTASGSLDKQAVNHIENLF